jgi:predicted secreted protein
MFHNRLRRQAGVVHHARILLAGIIFIIQPLLAEETAVRYDQINLNTYAAMEVENDIQIAVMYAQKEGPELAPLSDQVNRLITQAVQQAKQHDNIKVVTFGYQTSPRYHQKQMTGWRVRQSIRLESKDNQAMSKLLGGLQSSLALESLNYNISPKRRLEVEENLTTQAIDAFRKRAEQVTKQMNRKHYRLVEMTIQTTDQKPPAYRMRTGMMALGGSASAPTLEGGSQSLRVEISGRIELQLQ